jgi:hypothetical protein
MAVNEEGLTVDLIEFSLRTGLVGWLQVAAIAWCGYWLVHHVRY